MRFFDCNCFVGLPMNGALKPAATADELLARMDRAGRRAGGRSGPAGNAR